MASRPSNEQRPRPATVRTADVEEVAAEPMPSPLPETGSARLVCSAMKNAGPAVAWVAAVVTGWNLAREADLLETVLRAASVWLGVLVLWLAGVSLCERVILKTKQ